MERAIQYIRHSFFAARSWTDLEDLNKQALSWCIEIVGLRSCPTQREFTVLSVFEKEKLALIELAANPYPCAQGKDVQVGKTPYVRYDLNDYSVPHKFVRRQLTVRATPDLLKIFDVAEEVAHHIRCYDKGHQIEDQAHVKALEKYKEKGRKHRVIDELRHAAPSSQEFMKQAAERSQSRSLNSDAERIFAFVWSGRIRDCDRGVDS